MGKLFLGTSGWSYKDWIGPLYRSSTEQKLARYVEVFSTAEINSTFYAYPSKGLVWGWTKNTPEDFTFTAKLPRIITHEKMLEVSEGADKDLKSFLDVMNPLNAAGKLGCLLIQLPPSFDYRPDTLREFLEALPSDFDFAVEFRNLAWMREETFGLLKDFSVAYTNVDEPLLPPAIHVTAKHAYIRWHGRRQRPWFNYRYSPEELEPWIPKIKKLKESTEKTLGFFNNHFHGYAVENCIQVVDMLGELAPEQQKVQDHMSGFRAGRAVDQKTITEFKKGEIEADLERLMTLLMDRRRLDRARKIPESSVEIESSTGEVFKGKVKDYFIEIDTQEKRIVHDCDDWRKRISSKLFCKHMGSFFMALNEGESVELLEDIVSEKQHWSFAYPESD